MRSDADMDMSPISNAASSKVGKALTLNVDGKPDRLADRDGDGSCS